MLSFNDDKLKRIAPTLFRLKKSENPFEYFLPPINPINMEVTEVSHLSTRQEDTVTGNLCGLLHTIKLVVELATV